MACCKACGANLVWAKTEYGRYVPLDARQLIIKQTRPGDPKGTLYFTARGQIVQGYPLEYPEDGCTLAHTSHMVTCPAREQFKGRRRSGDGQASQTG